MKIRADYVSNSSSSSFFIIGNAFTEDDLAKAMDYNKIDENISIEEFLNNNEILKKFGLKCIVDYESDESEKYYVGLCFSDMKEDETKAQFINRIKDNFIKFFGKQIPVEEICSDIYC